MDILKIAGLFELDAAPVDAHRFGSGHINDTYRVTTESGRQYVLQRLNTSVFTEPEELTENLRLVGEHLRAAIGAAGGEPERETLTLVKAKDGSLRVIDESGYWRLTEFIRDSFSRDLATSPDDTRECGSAFGRFMSLLADFPAEKLAETIPNFHNTAWRIENLLRAAELDSEHRLNECGEVLEKYLSRAKAYSDEYKALAANLPLRVTHNDTKINNVLFDEISGHALAVIDLDTVMPGLAAFDFGDAIRTGAATADEDTTELEKMGVSVELFKAFAEGYLAMAEGLSDAEKASLVAGTRMMTYECGSRFLADFLSGDTYFKIKHPTHNLQRAAAQMALLEDIEDKSELLEQIVKEASK